MKINNRLTGIILGIALLLSTFIFFTKDEKPSPVFGTYRIYSTDPLIQRSIRNQNIFIKLNENNTIAYNTTINGKRKFDYSGTFIIDEKTNTLTIAWLGGKLPKQLKVEQDGEDFIIRVGETVYKKEKG